MTQKSKWNVLELLNTTSDYLAQKKIENPRLNAEQLLGKVLNINRVGLYVAFERHVTEKELAQFRQLVKRRAAHEPLQYILGQTEFMGLPFKVSPQVLIPRPETEILVETVISLTGEINSTGITVVDIGTGSGCIAVSMVKGLSDARIFATDISGEALEISAVNAQLNGLSTQYIEKNKNHFEPDNSDLVLVNHNIFNDWPDVLPQKVTILVSNPPYIASNEMTELNSEVRDYEPLLALTDEADGLRFYERLFSLASTHCDYICLEMSGSQPQKIIKMAQQHSFNNIEIINDYNGINRVLKIKV